MSLFATKTFWTGIGFMVFGIVGVLIGELEPTSGITSFLAGFGIISGRDALLKLQKE